MNDPRFHHNKGPFTLSELAKFGQCDIGRGDPSLLIKDVAPLDEAEPGTIGVFHNVKYAQFLLSTQASAIILSEDMVDKTQSNTPLLVSKHPYRSYALIANAFYPKEKTEEDIASTAVIHPTAKLGKGVIIGPMAVIGAHAEIGNNVEIGPLAVIGEAVVVGDNSEIGSHVSISHSIIGKHVNIKPGARIGQQGFGFFMDQGDMGGHVSVPQLGRVLIHDFAEVGSNTTIDRGSGHDTVIGMGTRIDNLVQIAHNVHLGKGCVIVAQVGISGSTKIGDYVAAGGQAGIIDHLKIGTGVRIAAQSGIMRDLAPGEAVCGSPAMPIKTHYRQIAMLRQLTESNRKKLSSR